MSASVADLTHEGTAWLTATGLEEPLARIMGIFALTDGSRPIAVVAIFDLASPNPTLDFREKVAYFGPGAQHQMRRNRPHPQIMTSVTVSDKGCCS